jgi:small subunit ribosomal protein S6
MREYEITVILRPDIDDESREEILNNVEGWLTHGEEESDKPLPKHWGLRSMAYPIEDFEDGYYVYYEAHLEPSRISEIERNILYSDEILRHLVVSKEV